MKGRRPISGHLALHLTAKQGEFCQKACCSTVQGHGGVLVVRPSRSAARGGQWDAPPVNGTSSPSAAKQKGWGQGGILADPARSLVLPSTCPQGVAPSWPGVSAPWEQSWAGHVGLGRGMEGLEKAKTPGCPRAKGYERSPKEQSPLQMCVRERNAA